MRMDYDSGFILQKEDLLAPPLAGINHLLESLGILLRAVVTLESVLFRHHHAFVCSTLQI